MAAKIHLKGTVFGRLTVLNDSGLRHKKGSVLWFCLCACGNNAIVRGDSLTSKHTSSCGCLHSDEARRANSTHGLSRGSDGKVTLTFRVWNAMMSRCYGTGKHTQYYKDRGITVCERWHHYPNFLADMGERPEGKSIDRKENKGNYELANCKWATDWEQGQNRSRGRLHFSKFPEVIEKRKTLTVRQLAEFFGVCESTMKYTLYRRIPQYLVQLTSQG